jgi:hypothetical protein
VPLRILLNEKMTQCRAFVKSRAEFDSILAAFNKGKCATLSGRRSLLELGINLASSLSSGNNQPLSKATGLAAASTASWDCTICSQVNLVARKACRKCHCGRARIVIPKKVANPAAAALAVKPAPTLTSYEQFTETLSMCTKPFDENKKASAQEAITQKVKTHTQHGKRERVDEQNASERNNVSSKEISVPQINSVSRWGVPASTAPAPNDAYSSDLSHAPPAKAPRLSTLVMRRDAPRESSAIAAESTGISYECSSSSAQPRAVAVAAFAVERATASAGRSCEAGAAAGHDDDAAAVAAGARRGLAQLQAALEAFGAARAAVAPRPPGPRGKGRAGGKRAADDAPFPYQVDRRDVVTSLLKAAGRGNDPVRGLRGRGGLRIRAARAHI